MADTSQTEEAEPSISLWRIMANYILESTEWKTLSVMCLLIQINIHYYIDFTAVQLCIKQGIYLLWEQGFHLFCSLQDGLCQNSVPGCYWTAHMGQEESNFGLLWETVCSFIFPKNAKLFFRWPNLICLTQKIFFHNV